jgi:hypothetical protein
LVINLLIGWIDGWTGASRHGLVSGWPIAAQVAFFVISHDLYIYRFHRLQHGNRWLWRLHEAHHSARHVADRPPSGSDQLRDEGDLGLDLRTAYWPARSRPVTGSPRRTRGATWSSTRSRSGRSSGPPDDVAALKARALVTSAARIATRSVSARNRLPRRSTPFQARGVCTSRRAGSA